MKIKITPQMRALLMQAESIEIEVDESSDLAVAKARIAELEAQSAIGRRAVGIDRDLLVDRIAEALSGTYYCTRVWGAWSYGTMTQNDFCDVGESETPAEIADMVITILRDAEQAAPEPATAAVDAGALEALRSAMSKLRAPMSREEYAAARASIIEAAYSLLARGE